MRFVPSLKLAAIASAVALSIGASGAWRATSWYYQSKEGKVVKAALETERAQSKQTIADLRQQAQNAVEASRGYQIEISFLRAHSAAAPARPVRLCINEPAPTTAVPSTVAATGGPNGATPTAGELPSGAGPDIGPRLYAQADRADELAAQVRGLQNYIERSVPRNVRPHPEK